MQTARIFNMGANEVEIFDYKYLAFDSINMLLSP